MRKRFSRRPAIVAAVTIAVCLFILFSNISSPPMCFDGEDDCKDIEGTKHGLVAELSVRYFGYRQKNSGANKSATATALASEVSQNTPSVALTGSQLAPNEQPDVPLFVNVSDNAPISEVQVKSPENKNSSSKGVGGGSQNLKHGTSSDNNLERMEGDKTAAGFLVQTPNELIQQASSQAPTSQTTAISTAELAENAYEVNKQSVEKDFKKQSEENDISAPSSQQRTYQEEYPIEDQKDFPFLDGSIVPANSLGKNNAMCSHHSCVVENVCVDHTQNDTWFTLTPVDFEPLEFISKGHNYSLTISQRDSLPATVKAINGTTHFITIDYTNWFFTILRAFSFYKNVEMYTGLGKDFNTMILFEVPFTIDLSLPFYHMFRAVNPRYAPLYDLRESLHGGESAITCFERAVFGFEYRGSMMSAFTDEHLGEIVERLTALSVTGDEEDAEAQSRAQRYLELNRTLATDMQDFQKYLLRQFRAEKIARKPKTALLVDRLLQRKGSLAPYRRIINRHELEAVLKDEGFTVTVVEFANLTTAEQIRMARETSLFVAMHGAGVTNAFWMHNTGCLLEMHTYHFQKWGYETMASYLGLPYVSWINTREDRTRETWHSKKSVKTVNFWRSRDQWVDKNEFRRAVREAKKKLRLASSRSHDVGE